MLIRSQYGLQSGRIILDKDIRASMYIYKQKALQIGELM